MARASRSVVVNQGTSISGDAGELVEELPMGLSLVVTLDDRSVDYETMLVEDRFENVADAALLLGRVLDLLNGHRMDAGEHRLQELGEHAVTEVGFDDHAFDVVGLAQHREGLERCLG
ncbi:hypothetical protein LZK80_11445 [Rhizobium leguminosarum]|nr:hypothetical protein LZK80_11445 [Rhizobium leguminosarum]